MPLFGTPPVRNLFEEPTSVPVVKPKPKPIPQAPTPVAEVVVQQDTGPTTLELMIALLFIIAFIVVGLTLTTSLKERAVNNRISQELQTVQTAIMQFRALQPVAQTPVAPLSDTNWRNTLLGKENQLLIDGKPLAVKRILDTTKVKFQPDGSGTITTEVSGVTKSVNF